MDRQGFSESPDQGVAIERLSEGQRACLRHVLLHRSSKEIARELSISPHTVDQRLRVAVRNLGVSTRFEAARLLAEFEGEGASPYQSLIYQKPGVGSPMPSDAIPVSISETQTPGIEASAVLPSGTRGWAIPRPWGERNDMTAAWRMAWIIMIAFGAFISFGVFIAGLEALSRIF